VTLPPIGGDLTARPQDYWTPKNYDGGSSGIITLRRALENSKNLVTARLLDGGIAGSAEQSLKRVCELALEAQLYLECVPHYPFVLGAQPLRLIDLAAFYAAIASEGARPSPYAIESIDQEGRTLYRRNTVSPTRIGSADQAAFYQLKTILQGVLERGTARSIRKLAPYVAGKTGTTDDENDTWFVGFTNDVTVAAWVGYDNADGKRRTLGRGQTGAKIAIPIVEPILEATWKYVVPKTVLNPPSAEASRHLVSAPIDLMTGDRITDGRKGFTEYFRADRWGQLADTQYRLVPDTEVYAFRSPEPWSDGEGGLMDDPYQAPYGQAPSWFEPPRVQAPATVPWWEDQSPRRRPQRVDPDYFWGRGPVY
jgi:membrane carboxypeptidase/penicillin-binding protein